MTINDHEVNAEQLLAIALPTPPKVPCPECGEPIDPEDAKIFETHPEPWKNAKRIRR